MKSENSVFKVKSFIICIFTCRLHRMPGARKHKKLSESSDLYCITYVIKLTR